MTAMPRLAIRTLGTLAIMLDGKPITGLRSDKARALLVYLAVENGYSHRRENLIELLWSEQPSKAANTNFRQTLSRLNRALSNAAGAPPFLEVTRQTVRWLPDSDYTIDVAALRSTISHQTKLATVDELYKGDFLAGFFVDSAPAFENWAATVREALLQGLQEALRQAADSALARGDFQEVGLIARRQLGYVPWEEGGHRALMQALAMQGHRNEALAQFDRCFEVLQQELGVEPSDETVALYERIATGVVAPSPQGAPTLPQPTTPFVGRIAEITHIMRLLRLDDCRLLTLTGAGGIGKTRLALAIAAAVLQTGDRNVAFVSLVGIDNASQAKVAAAQALGLVPTDPTQLEGQISAALHNQAALLMLDNAEPLLAADGDSFVAWLNRLLRDARGSTVLVTSRQPIHASAEWVLPVDGMALPPAVQSAAPDHWRQYDAVALFEQRAQRARSTFLLSGQNAAAVGQLCRLLDGVPLAIELAAAQIDSRTVQALLDDLGQHVEHLRADIRDLPLRHRSLHAVFEHSWMLLDAGEQRALLGCAVFADGFSRAAARLVLNVETAQLYSLHAKSLLQRFETPDGLTRTRFALAIPLRNWLRTTIGVPESVRDSHAAFFLQWGVTHREQLAEEHDNLEAAWRWAHGRPSVAVPPSWDSTWLKATSNLRQVPSESRAPADLVLVGRDSEMARLREAIRPIQTNSVNGGLITVLGEAGIGKSHLVAQLKDAALSVTWIDCPTDETSAQALRPFRTWLYAYFNQQPAATQQDNLQAFKLRLDDLVCALPDPQLAADLEEHASLLAALVDIYLPNSLYARLQPAQRGERFQHVIKALIKAESCLQPVIVHVEDGHWLDRSSAELIAYLLRNVEPYPFAVIVTARPAGYEPPFLSNVPLSTIRVEPLEAQSVVQLAAAYLDGAPDAALTEWLLRHGVGNPFYTEQLLRYLVEYGLVANGRLLPGRSPLTDSVLPLDVRNVMVARLNFLEPEVRDVVEQAAVVGREFSLATLREVVADDGAVARGVAAAEKASIWQRLSAERYVFNHALLHDSAYDSQFESQRQLRHAQAAQAVGATHQRQFAVAANHYAKAGKRRRAAAQYQKAGDQARNNYFLREAHTHYTRGLELAQSDDQRLHLYLGREQINYWLGNRAQQKEDLRQITGLLPEKNRRLQADVTLRRATLALVTGHYDMAVRLAKQATFAAKTLSDVALEAEAMHRWARALWQQGRPQSAERILRRALILAQRTRSITLQAKCHYDLAILAYYHDQYAAAREQLEQSLPLFEQQADKRNVARCADLLGVIAYTEGHYETALKHYQLAVDLSRAIEWPYGEANFTSHIGSCYFDLGLYERSQALHERALSLSRQLDDREFEVQSVDALGLILQAKGDLHAARQAFEEAVALANGIDHAELQVYTLTHLGIVLADLEEVEEAGLLLYEAIALHGATRANRAELNTLAALAWLDMAQGDGDLAVERAREVVQKLMDEGTDGVEQPLAVFLQCYKILQAVGQAEEARHLLETAHALLQSKAQLIEDVQLRTTFLYQVPAHRAIAERWQSLSS